MSSLQTDEDVPLSLADRAYRSLLDQLITLAIRPGDPIDDARIARELEVGRTPVREALKRLEEDRLVIAYPRRGTFATGVDITDLAHINEIRLALEPLAAARAATHATPVERQEMTELVARFADPDGLLADRTELMRLDLAVHRAMYAASGNPHLQGVLVRHHNLATRIFCLFLPRLTDVGEHVGEHVDLLQAIVDGAADRASTLAREHVEHFETAVRAVI